MKNLFDLNGKIAAVTGAGSGLGASASKAYAEAGADVVLFDMNQAAAEAVAEEIRKMGRKAGAYACDVSSDESVKAAVEKAYADFGRIDILLNDAGVAVGGGVDSMTEAAWDKSFNVNVKGIFHMSKYIVPHMKEQKYGKIVNVASVNAFIADKDDLFIRHSYNASKAAVVGLTKGMACSYARYGITVNGVGPGLFETGMTKDTLFKSNAFLAGYSKLCPADRPAHLDEINGTFLYLSSDASSYVQGQIILVDGGVSIV